MPMFEKNASYDVQPPFMPFWTRVRLSVTGLLLQAAAMQLAVSPAGYGPILAAVLILGFGIGFGAFGFGSSVHLRIPDKFILCKGQLGRSGDVLPPVMGVAILPGTLAVPAAAAGLSLVTVAVYFSTAIMITCIAMLLDEGARFTSSGSGLSPTSPANYGRGPGSGSPAAALHYKETLYNATLTGNCLNR